MYLYLWPLQGIDMSTHFTIPEYISLLSTHLHRWSLLSVISLYEHLTKKKATTVDVNNVWVPLLLVSQEGNPPVWRFEQRRSSEHCDSSITPRCHTAYPWVEQVDTALWTQGQCYSQVSTVGKGNAMVGGGDVLTKTQSEGEMERKNTTEKGNSQGRNGQAWCESAQETE